MALPIFVQEYEGTSLSLAGPSGLAVLYSSETWTQIEKPKYSFNTFALRPIFGYWSHDNMSNCLVLRKAELRQVTCIVRERHLILYGHAARLPP